MLVIWYEYTRVSSQGYNLRLSRQYNPFRHGVLSFRTRSGRPMGGFLISMRRFGGGPAIIWTQLIPLNQSQKSPMSCVTWITGGTATNNAKT